MKIMNPVLTHRRTAQDQREKRDYGARKCGGLLCLGGLEGVSGLEDFRCTHLTLYIVLLVGGVVKCSLADYGQPATKHTLKKKLFA